MIRVTQQPYSPIGLVNSRKRPSGSPYLSIVVRNYGDVFDGGQAAVAKALARRRIISFAKSSRVKVHWNGAADFS